MGKDINGIYEVKFRDDDRVQVMHAKGVFSASADQLPAEFLASWGLHTNSLEQIHADRQKEAAAGFESAVREGSFRVVEGVVYDLRKYQPEWSYFKQAKPVRIMEKGEAIFDVSSDPNTVVLIVVENLPSTPVPGRRMDINAKLVSSFDYMDTIGNTRKLRLFDVGRACSRQEVPEAILVANKPQASLGESAASEDLLSKLPDARDLKATGSGFFISDDGYLLTNWHVVENSKRLKIKCKQGIFSARVVKSDVRKDLALLKAEGQFEPLSFADENVAGLGESAFTIGFPNVELQGMEPKFTDGKISSLSGLKDDPDQYQISVPVQPGNSGGPLLNQAGKVIGIVEAQLSDWGALRATGSLPQNVNYAIKGNIAFEFARQHPKLRFRLGADSSNLQEAVKKAKDSVVLVLVY